LIAQAAVTLDRQQRLAIFQKAEAILLEEAPVIPLFNLGRIYLSRPEIKGWYPNLLDEHPFKFVSLQKS
jgi:oligopeptide transport system substrate-binding protein